MSAESPRGSADVSTSSPAQATAAGGSSGDAARRADFGPNQWLVDELYQRYLADPGSVDQAWWSFFADYHPQPGPSGAVPGAVPESATAVSPTRPAGTAAARPSAPGPGRPVPAAGTTAPADGAAGPARTAAADRNGGTAAAPAAAGPVRLAPTTGVTPPAPGAPETVTAPGDGAGPGIRLRGAAARTVANMTASLAVPTATSVRAVPAKLLIDNRIVINNHLARGRGGKVSFTHLIGYAVVRALAAVPEMNFSFAAADGTRSRSNVNDTGNLIT